MQVDSKFLKIDDLGRNHVTVDADAVEGIYRHNHLFWTTRNLTELSEEVKQKIINDQEGGSNPYKRGTILKLQEIFAESSERGEFSMLEIGAANGNVMLQIEERFPNPRLNYVGFECLPILVEDFRERFPDQTMHIGDVEDFISKENSFFSEVPFTLFYASVVFIMIKPDLVRRALQKAAELTDQFLIYDYVEDTNVELGPAETLVLQMPNRPVFWFVHPWADYLTEVGFKIIDKQVAKLTETEAQSPLHDHQVRGVGYIHAIRE